MAVANPAWSVLESPIDGETDSRLIRNKRCLRPCMYRFCCEINTVSKAIWQLVRREPQTYMMSRWGWLWHCLRLQYVTYGLRSPGFTCWIREHKTVSWVGSTVAYSECMMHLNILIEADTNDLTKQKTQNSHRQPYTIMQSYPAARLPGVYLPRLTRLTRITRIMFSRSTSCYDSGLIDHDKLSGEATKSICGIGVFLVHP